MVIQHYDQPDIADRPGQLTQSAGFARPAQPPIITVGQQGGMILPTGEGIGATQPVCAVMSFARAAGMLSIITVPEPIAIMPGPPGTQLGSMHGADVSATRAAGGPPIMVLLAPLMIANGSAG